MKRLYGTSCYIQSVGVKTDLEIDGFAIAVCHEIGVELDRHRSRSFDEMEQWGDDLSSFDLVLALSPASQRRALDLTRFYHLDVEYWPILDPTGLGESREARLASYRQARGPRSGSGLLERFGPPRRGCERPRLRILRGAEVEARRCAGGSAHRVFREWPYLYDGDPAYGNAANLSRTPKIAGRHPRGAFEAGGCGAATGSPWRNHAQGFSGRAFGGGRSRSEASSTARRRSCCRNAGRRFRPCASSTRGRPMRRALGRSPRGFCAVLRPRDHPRRPREGPKALDAFWRGRVTSRPGAR